MSLLLQSETIHLPYREPFRIARAHGGDGMSSVVVELRNEGWPDLVGYGEGYPDAYYGEVVAAALRLTQAIDAAALAEFCKGRIARFKIPTRFFQLAAFPLTASGKIRKTELREMGSQGKLEPLS